MHCSDTRRPRRIPLTAVGHLVVTEDLRVVRAATERVKSPQAVLYDASENAPMISGTDTPVLEIPREALAVTAAAAVDVDARWGPISVRGLAFELVERIDGAELDARWLLQFSRGASPCSATVSLPVGCSTA